MAKYEKRFKGDFDQVLNCIDDDILNSSFSAKFEDGSDISIEQLRVAVRVYERYSMMGGNRVSLNVTLVGSQNDLYITAITSGGSQAVLFKINTIGEETFLELLSDSVENYILKNY